MTGFSFTENDAGYARSEADVARDLYEAMRQFFIVFDAHAKSDFYVTGESYAGMEFNSIETSAVSSLISIPFCPLLFNYH